MDIGGVKVLKSDPRAKTVTFRFAGADAQRAAFAQLDGIGYGPELVE